MMITMQDVLVRQCCAQGLQPPAVATSRCSRGHRRPRTVCFAAQDDAGSSTASRRSALMTLTAVAGAAASSTWVSYAAAGTYTCRPGALASIPTATSAAAYAQRGPFEPVDLPRLQHTCVTCFPACVGDQCLLDIHVTYPKGGSSIGLRAPYPLVVFTGGFVVGSTAYRETAAHLASWGYTVVRYDTRDVLSSPCDDVTHVALLRELISWTATHPLLRQIADPGSVYLAGHSRGGKLSTLAAAEDERVKALCLWDPVDVTQYAPLSERFPSAVAALQRAADSGRFLPVAVIGSSRSSDCAPDTSNFHHFYSAAPSAAWSVVLGDAGHFQFLDAQSPLQKAVCGAGAAEADQHVRLVSRSVLVAWGELMVRGNGRDVLSHLAARGCSSSSYGTPGSHSSSSSSSSGPSWPSLGSWSPVEAGPAQAAALPADTTTSSSSSSSAGPQQQQFASQAPPSGDSSAAMLAQSTGSDPAAAATAAAEDPGAGAGPTSRGLPLTQTPISSWLGPPPAQLQLVRQELQHLVTSLSYQTAPVLEVTSTFKNFG